MAADDVFHMAPLSTVGVRTSDEVVNPEEVASLIDETTKSSAPG